MKNNEDLQQQVKEYMGGLGFEYSEKHPDGCECYDAGSDTTWDGFIYYDHDGFPVKVDMDFAKRLYIAQQKAVLEAQLEILADFINGLVELSPSSGESFRLKSRLFAEIQGHRRDLKYELKELENQ